MRFILYLAILGLPAVLSQTQSPDQDPSLPIAMSVNLQDRNNPDFKICMRIKTDVPFHIEWTNGTIRNTLAGKLGKPEDDAYPLNLTVTEGADYSGTTGFKLKLDKPIDEDFVASSAFNVIYHQKVALSKKGCS